ncbi:SusC/RagA family TonB-linked outer membrane protein [Myroides marinus]|uniref:SusC/RagA family TonB-linked outer membrane protein n=1 Tax=Myroides marinus TaxID=703342 RepID=A0A161RXA8_9FLAO|nr:SusC/RagA family TonB-linked outer membrane protein [Myroides marinus]KZE76169.1 SusC/RagA family TonB-linked outer membrane protein [Myroides marinus]
MKTQNFTSYSYRIILLLSFLVAYPNYAVNSNLLVDIPYNRQDNKQKQKTRLTGTVKDAQGSLGGVIVSISSNRAVTTDINGHYSIDIVLGEKITFSMIGYKEQSIIYTTGSLLNITLIEDNSTLDEIVVNAGYYSVKDRERTGSIARVTAKDIEFQPVVNPLQAMQGRMAGVDITQSSGVAGGNMDIEIRGRNFMGDKLSGRNNPLYIIDGVPFLSDALGLSSGNTGIEILQNGISPLNAINPNDIESIEVLKDADATAIYGSRGANGVVLITTKKSTSETTRFTVSSATSFSKVPKYMELMNTQQYIQMREEAFANSGTTNLPANAYDLNGTWDRDRYTNWQKELIGKTATAQDISLGINGGSNQTHFNINLTHNNSNTVFPIDKGYKRNSVLIGINHQSQDNKLHLNLSTSYSNQSNNLPTMDLTRQALTLAPNAPALYDQKGNLNWQEGTFTNPLAQLEGSYENKTNSLILNMNLSYSLFKNLDFRINTGLTTNNLEERNIIPHTVFNPSDEYTSEMSESSLATSQSQSFIVEPQLNYKKSWNKHTFELLVGSTFQSTESDNQNISGRNFSSNALIRNISAAKDKYIGISSKAQYKYAALFTRINYQYDNKYYLNLTGRRDGSSRFAENNRFGNFGALGAAWIFSEESFAKNLTWLSFGKLRSSYGITGSDNIGDYAYLDSYTVFAPQYNAETGLSPTSLHNTSYKWEKTTKLEAALELSFLQNRINTSIAYYNNRSTDQLVGMTLPTTTGFSTILMNSPAVVENKGWEFTLNTNNISTADWKWSTNFNISFPKNVLVSYPGLEQGTQSSFYVVGESLNIVKLYQYEGIDPNTGEFTFKDFDDNGIINAQDQQVIKNLNPKFYGGLQNTISYKNFTLDFLFYFKKQENYNLNQYYNVAGAAIVNQPVQMTDRWSSSNPNGTYMPAGYRNSDLNKLATPFKRSDATISDASYIRLKNVSLSYVLKIPKAHIESLRIYLQGQNLWTITSYKGMDPEFTTFGYLPPLRTYAFGMQLIF